MEHVQSPLTVVPAFSCRSGMSDPEGGPRRLPLGTIPLGQLTGVWLLLQDLDAGNTIVARLYGGLLTGHLDGLIVAAVGEILPGLLGSRGLQLDAGLTHHLHGGLTLLHSVPRLLLLGGSLSARGRVSWGHSHTCSLKIWTS
jgi:hypothetical protein